MPEDSRRSATAFVDGRGLLLPVEFDEVPFEPRRAFVVVGAGEPVTRGGHVAGSRELLTLVTGSASVKLASADEGDRVHQMSEPGDTVLVGPDDHVTYDLSEHATLLVLADRPFLEAAQHRGGGA